MITRFLPALALAALVAGGLGFAATQEKGQEQAKTVDAAASGDAAVIAAQKPAYPLSVCVISGEPLGSMGDPIEHVVDGRLVRLCCKGCTKAVLAKKQAIFARIDAAVIAEQKPLWAAAIAACPISGEAFEEGEPVDFVVGTRYFKLCCNGCKKGVSKDTAKILARIDAAMMAEQAKSYPLTTCVVSGEPLEADGAVDEFYGVTLVRLCCKGCKKGFAKNPESFVAKVKEARKTAGQRG